ncbi:PREDICTED: FHA domain-containing protein At4g14490 [Tarenaya hassleriana]|uniref:FHA domain-containing protein At4g14490 n=1 Tax=Tarenaya hassleriana TaxID=28532 RepID=UPI00053C5E0F|nr:PREDICTED: FHA domain-containing protein At4g14490 [Tarenaya hassleriana]
MNPPLLKLVFLQGPREGETLEYKPGSTVRIGRIARGNDLAIKDAGISSKHLRIEWESEKWMVQDLGSSNGTALNTTPLPADTPFDLRHGDTIKLGEYTSIVVNFEIDAQENDMVQEHKLPPKPRRNNRRQAVAESDPVGSIQKNSTRKGRSAKQTNETSKENDGEQELPRRGRVSRSKIAEDVAEEVKFFEERDEKKVNSRVTRTKKNKGLENSCSDGEKVAIADAVKEEDVGEEMQGKKGNSRVRRSRNIDNTQSSCLDLGKLETENIAKGVENLEVKDEKRVNRRGMRSKKIENAQNSCSGLGNVENADIASETTFEVSEKQDGNRVNSRVTRSKKNEIPGDSYLVLEMVESQARIKRAGKKKKEEKLLESVESKPMKDDKVTDAGKEGRISTVEEGMENEQDMGLREEHCDLIDREIDCRAERDSHEAVDDKCEVEGAAGSGAKLMQRAQVVIEKTTLGEEGETCTIKEEIEDLRDLDLPEECHDTIDKGRDYAEACSEATGDRCDEEKGTKMSHVKNVDQVDVDLGKMTLGQWFDFLEVHLPKQIIEETEKMIEPMRSKSQRVYEYIVEQKKGKGKRPVWGE